MLRTSITALRPRSSVGTTYSGCFCPGILHLALASGFKLWAGSCPPIEILAPLRAVGCALVGSAAATLPTARSAFLPVRRGLSAAACIALVVTTATEPSERPKTTLLGLDAAHDIAHRQPALDFAVRVVAQAEDNRYFLEGPVRLAQVDEGSSALTIQQHESIANAQHVLNLAGSDRGSGAHSRAQRLPRRVDLDVGCVGDNVTAHRRGFGNAR